ncbi:retrovirus-related pol polyprotein from transposon TNT 1-94 [Tanacetum coccineum]
MAKASSSQAWLWHRHLSHLIFNSINLLSKYDIVTSLPKLKFGKDHLCSSCELGKAKRKSFKTKTTPSSKTRLQILHMDLCGPMRVESFNGKKYVLVIVDDYSIYTWTHFLRSKDETSKVLINFLKLVQRGLHAQGILLSQELTGLMFDELFNGSTPVVSKSSVVIATDAPDQHQQQNTTPYTSTTVTADTPPLNIQKAPVTTSQEPTQVLTVTATENINQVETQKENAQVNKDKFINIFSTTVHEQGETSSQYVDSSNMHTFYQRHPFEHRWTRNHPLEKVIGNPSQSIRTRHHLETDGEISMQEELYQFE